MKQLINRTQKLTLYVCFLLFIISSAYMVTYALILRDISARTFTIHYSMIHYTLARPIFFFTITALVCTAFLLWADKTISQKIKKQSFTLFILLLVTYLILFIIYFIGMAPYFLFLLIHNPVIPVLLGLLLSITIPKNKEKTGELQTNS